MFEIRVRSKLLILDIFLNQLEYKVSDILIDCDESC